MLIEKRHGYWCVWTTWYKTGTTVGCCLQRASISGILAFKFTNTLVSSFRSVCVNSSVSECHHVKIYIYINININNPSNTNTASLLPLCPTTHNATPKITQVEHGVLSKVENANGIVTLLKELGRENKTAVAVAATHCLRRVFVQLLDPAKNPQVNADQYIWVD